MDSGPVVADTPLEELMAMTVPELISWLTKNKVSLPSSKQTKQYYRNLAMQTPNINIGGTQFGDDSIVAEPKQAKPRRKKEASPANYASPNLNSPSVTTRSRQAAALRAKMEAPVTDSPSVTNASVPDKEIEMDFPMEAGEVVAAPESPPPVPVQEGAQANNLGETQKEHDPKAAVRQRAVKKPTRKSPKLTPRVYCVLPILIVLIALIIGVFTQFYAFHVVIDPASNKYQFFVTPRSHRP